MQLTGLHIAAYFGLKEAMVVLIENRYNPNDKNTYSRTPLSYAADRGHDAVVKLLLEKGAELEIKDKYYDRTPLLYAAEKGYEAVVKLLLEKGAELETKDKYCWTPLLHAAENGHEAIVKLLLKKSTKKLQ